jgi:hypothetical protein
MRKGSKNTLGFSVCQSLPNRFPACANGQGEIIAAAKYGLDLISEM